MAGGFFEGLGGCVCLGLKNAVGGMKKGDVTG